MSLATETFATAHYSRESDWATPQVFFDEINLEFRFTLDACALPHNAKCARYFTPEQDGLKQPWSGVVWMNPPYGRAIGKWMQKAWESAEQGARVVCLVPARTDTEWWHRYAMLGTVRFIKGRLRFNDADRAPFPSALVIFEPVRGVA